MDKKQVIVIGTANDKCKLAMQQITRSKTPQILVITEQDTSKLIELTENLNEFTNNRASRRGIKNHKAWESKRYHK